MCIRDRVYRAAVCVMCVYGVEAVKGRRGRCRMGARRGLQTCRCGLHPRMSRVATHCALATAGGNVPHTAVPAQRARFRHLAA
eukprot:5347181-Prymnesium_polylepis.1